MTHTLSWSAGCGFGHTYCGAYCYAASLPNWLYSRQPSEAWGDAVIVKVNAAQILNQSLAKMSTYRRRQLRIFMSTVSDPYQPLEARYRLSRESLRVFREYPEIDLLLLQTRSPLVAQDFSLMRAIPYLWLSVTIETDDQQQLKAIGSGGASLAKRFAIVEKAADAGINVQVAVSPCLPYTPKFVARLIASGAQRIVVDTFVDGDGSRGKRAAGSPFATKANYDWSDDDPARVLYENLLVAGVDAGWSCSGFCGIPHRNVETSL